jgi:hypothetical protein
VSTETLLRLSLIQAELRKLAAGLDGGQAKVVNQSAALLNLFRVLHDRQNDRQSTPDLTRPPTGGSSRPRSHRRRAGFPH